MNPTVSEIKTSVSEILILRVVVERVVKSFGFSSRVSPVNVLNRVVFPAEV